MSYRGKNKGNYTQQPRRFKTSNSAQQRNRGYSRRDTRLAKAAFSGRSERSQMTDLAKQAQIAPNLEVWLRSPTTSDFPGVDVKLSGDPVERKKQAEDLVQIATEKNLEVEVREPKNKKPIRRFRVLKKEEAEKLEKEQKQKSKVETIEKPQKELKQKEDDNSPLIEGHKMPSKAEILEKAKELYMHDNARFLELGENLPEESELREEGYLKKAQLELLTKEDTKATRQVLDYVGNLKNELEQIGFTIIPVEGFTL